MVTVYGVSNIFKYFSLKNIVNFKMLFYWIAFSQVLRSLNKIFTLDEYQEVDIDEGWIAYLCNIDSETLYVMC